LLIVGGALLFVSMFINGRGAMSHATWLWNSRPIGVDEHPERLWDWRQPQFMAGWLPHPLPRTFPPAAGRIDFTATDADRYIWYGWSGREESFRWTDGREASLVFSLNPVTDTSLAMKLGPYLEKGKLRQQRVEIKLNGIWIETVEMAEEKTYEYKFLMPKNLLSEKNLLTFVLPNANSPRALRNDYGDPRQLGIAVYWIELQPQAAQSPTDAGR
jgi:hypothetical protein